MGNLLQSVTKSLTPIADGLLTRFSPTTPPLSSQAPVIGVSKAPKVIAPIPTAPVINQIPKPATPVADNLLARYAPAVAKVQAATRPTGFLKNAGDSMTTTVHTVASAADRFLAGQEKNVSDAATGKLPVNVDDILGGLKKTGVGSLKVTQSLAQGFNQGIFRIGTSLAQATLPGYKPGGGELLKSLTGDEKPSTYQDVYSKTYDWAVAKAATPTQASSFAGLAVLGNLFADNPADLPAKEGFALTKEGIDQLVKAGTDDEARTILKSHNPHMPDPVADFVAPIFKSAKTPEEVKSALKLINSTAEHAATKAESKAIVDKAKQAEPTPTIPEHLQPLAEEARKYGSADEFIATQEPVLRGGKELDKSAKTDMGISVTRDPETASAYAGSHVLKGGDKGNILPGEGAVHDLYISPEARVFNAKDAPKDLIKNYIKNDRVGGRERIAEYARDNGFDAVDFKAFSDPEIRVFNENVLNTKKELKDLYTQATKSVEKPGISYHPTDEPVFEKPVNTKSEAFSPNLVKSLGGTKDPYAILGALKPHFPHLPDRVLDRIVDRLTTMKRVENIEGMLRSAKNLDDRMKAGSIKTADRLGPKVEKTFGRKLTDKEQVAADIKRTEEAKLPKSSEEVISKTTSPAVRKLMRQDQKVSYLRTLRDKFDDQKSAVAGESEYNRIWDSVNQRVVERYQDLSLQHELMKDALSNHDAGSLFQKYYKRTDIGDPTNELQELRNRAMKRKQAIDDYTRGLGSKKPAPLTKQEQSLIGVDAEVEGLGFRDLADAQSSIEKYTDLRQQIEDVGKEIKELKPQVREARILQQGLDDVAVIPKAKVLDIDRLATPALIRDSYTDIVRTSGQIRDVYRNFKVFFGNKFEEIKKAILDPFDESKGRFADEVNGLGDELAENVVGQLGIRRGSKLSEAVQRYGDKGLPPGEQRTYKQLVEEFGKEDADKVVKADEWFRSTYDRLIDELNEVRRKLYPNNASKLIAHRSDYYRHYQELGESFGDAVREFLAIGGDIDPKLAGLSEYTKPKSKFLSFAQERMGKKTTIDAVGGFTNYIPSFAYAKHIDPEISKFRYLRRQLADSVDRLNGGVEVYPALRLPDGSDFKPKGVNNFLGFLDDFSNDLAGKTNPLDRYVQDKLIPGGRKTMRAVDWVNRRVNSNTILGNLGTLFAQTANIPMAVASAKQYSLEGAARTIAGIFTHNEPMEKSLFLKERYLRSPNSRFPVPFSEKPVTASVDAGREKLAQLLEVADEIGTKFTWNAHYAQGLARELDNPIKYADDMTRSIVAGRGIGEVPLAQKAKLFRLFNPFQLEVGNFWWVAKDFADRKDFQALAYLTVGNYLFNQLSNEVTGHPVVYDPAQALFDGTKDLIDGWKSGDPATGGLKFLGRQAGEVLSNLPVGQTIASTLVPETARKGLFGTADPTRYGGGVPFVTALQKASSSIYSLLTGGFDNAGKNAEQAVESALPLTLPYGGNQVKKTYEGLKALLTGSVDDSAGRQSYTVSRDPVNVVQAMLFGKGATAEARKLNSSREDLFSRIDKQSNQNTLNTLSAEADWSHIQRLSKSGNKSAAASYLADIAKKNPEEAKRIAKVAADEERGLTSTDRLVGMLGVANGERAKYISEQLKTMGSGKQKADYIADLAKKKLINGEVVKQLTVFLSK